MRAMQIIEWGKPLEARDYPDPEPKGEEVVVRVEAAGVCHSDVHIWEGYFDLGDGKKVTLESRGVKLPFTLGHEIAGEVAAVGPNASGVKVGDKRVVFPWIGCGRCAVCERGEELLCLAPRDPGPRGQAEVAHPIGDPEVHHLGHRALVGGHFRRLLVEHPGGRLSMDVRPAGEGVTEMLVARDVGEDAQLDLRVVRGEERHVGAAGDERVADPPAERRPDRDVLEVRIRRAQAPGRRDGLVEGRMEAAVRREKRRQRLDVR